MRASIQRDVIFKIVDNSFDHLSAEEVYELARKEITNISLGTVYRNLNQLLENKKIVRIKDDNFDRYDTAAVKHNHFICKECGKVIDIYDKYIFNVEKINDNIITEYDLVFRGICSDCKNKEV